ncbi:uncharacterized protein LOC110019685 [Phalaenopsis equestris]|uniref:uncharacterized protein LOC110019685 n=1 Tax=Phalaenopsis equestris TaxID=78828 RepID=UPI0009E381F5|nr:uncharacterized protein LOC110019685 [Phalaenopsis equestris]
MTASDHRPLLITISASPVKHKASFRYLNMWSSHTDFLNQVSLGWRDCHHSNPLKKLWLLQKKIDKHLSKWNWNVVGDVNLRVKEANKEVLEMEARLEKNPDTELNLLLANEKLMNAICMQEEFYAQKAAKIRFYEGDRNTKYFHACINYRRRCNTIHKIKDPLGHWIYSEDLIATTAIQYFQTLFTQPPFTRMSIQQDLFDQGYTRNLKLDSIPGELEIWSALNSIDSSEVAGPDGFSADFYKKAWKIIKGDVIEATLCAVVPPESNAWLSAPFTLRISIKPIGSGISTAPLNSLRKTTSISFPNNILLLLMKDTVQKGLTKSWWSISE